MNQPHEPFDQAVIYRGQVLEQLSKSLPVFRRLHLVEILEGLDQFILDNASQPTLSVEQIKD